MEGSIGPQTIAKKPFEKHYYPLICELWKQWRIRSGYVTNTEYELDKQQAIEEVERLRSDTIQAIILS